VARPEGFEPPTSSFEGLHSIQLSYERAVVNSLPKDRVDENTWRSRTESGKENRELMRTYFPRIARKADDETTVLRGSVSVDFVNREPIVIILYQLAKRSGRVEDVFAER
jgi:hypothetical protein